MAQAKTEQQEKAPERPEVQPLERAALLEAIRQAHGAIPGEPRLSFLYHTDKGMTRRFRINYEKRDGWQPTGYSACFWATGRLLANGHLIVDRLDGGLCRTRLSRSA